jgi:hypothetical protein
MTLPKESREGIKDIQIDSSKGNKFKVSALFRRYFAKE